MLIITRGSSCVGKSSICNALAAVQSSWHIVCEDDIYLDLMVQALDQLFPQAMLSICSHIPKSNIYHALQRNQIVMYEHLSEQDQEHTLNALHSIRSFLNDPIHNYCLKSIKTHIKHTMLATVYWYAAQGYNVLFDQTLCNKHDLVSLKECFTSVLTVGFHCQPSTLIARFIQRNTDANTAHNLHNKRFLKQVLYSYFKSLTPAAANKPCIGTFTKETLDTLFDVAVDYLTEQPVHESAPDGLFTRGEFTLAECNTFKQEVYERFGLTTSNTVKIAYAHPHDLLLYTDKQSALVMAELLLYKATQLPGIDERRKRNNL